MSFDISLRNGDFFIVPLSNGGGFQAAWALNSNVVIGAGQ